MPRVTFNVSTPLEPDQVIAAVTDFSPRRAERWPSLDSSVYRVHDRGTTWAEVTEGGGPFPGIWARERYDWSSPLRVRATIVESSVFQPGGTWTLEASPAAAGQTGTIARVTWDRRPRGLKGAVLTTMVVLVGRAALASDLRAALAS